MSSDSSLSPARSILDGRFVDQAKDIKRAMSIDNIVDSSPSAMPYPTTPPHANSEPSRSPIVQRHQTYQPTAVLAAIDTAPTVATITDPTFPITPESATAAIISDPTFPITPESAPPTPVSEVAAVHAAESKHSHGHDHGHTTTAQTDYEVETADVDMDREFNCINDEFAQCQTGQYTKNLSRKVISNHFGRNKACTRIITDWPLFCRKHYQRATYKPQLWQRRKVSLILRQFDIIERQHPGTTYNVALKKAEEARLNDFSRKVAAGTAVAVAVAAVAPDVEIKSFQAPIDVLRELETSLGKGKTVTQVKESVNVILDMLTKGETKEVPAIEFLPNLSKTSLSRKKTTIPRVSAKGGIQKAKKAKKAKKA